MSQAFFHLFIIFVLFYSILLHRAREAFSVAFHLFYFLFFYFTGPEMFLFFLLTGPETHLVSSPCFIFFIIIFTHRARDAFLGLFSSPDFILFFFSPFYYAIC